MDQMSQNAEIIKINPSSEILNPQSFITVNDINQPFH